MDGSGDKFFSASGFASNQHGAVGRCDVCNQVLDVIHCLAATDQLRITFGTSKTMLQRGNWRFV